MSRHAGRHHSPVSPRSAKGDSACRGPARASGRPRSSDDRVDPESTTVDPEEPTDDRDLEPPDVPVRQAAAGLGATALGRPPPRPVGAQRPVVIASANGLRTVEKAMELIKAGADPLDAAIEGVAIVEADPNDHTVGYGGIPNEDGVVELDAAVMHGPTHGGGAVAVAAEHHAPGRRRPAGHEADRPLPARRRGGAAVRPRCTASPRSTC